MLSTQILLMNPTRTRLNPIQMNRSRLNLNPMSRSLRSLSLTNQNLTRNRSNPNRNRPNLTPPLMSRSLMSLIRTRQTRLRHSQFLPYKQLEKRKKGSRAPEEIVNDSASLTLPLNRPVLVPIVRGGELACV